MIQFSNRNQLARDVTTNIMTQATFVQPDVKATLIQLHHESEVKRISDKQNKTSEIIIEIKTSMNDIVANVRLV